MGLFDAPGRSLVREPGDIYREKADRLTAETRQLFGSRRFVDAEERVRELIQLQSSVVGERHPEYATGLCLLARVLSAQDELSDAETLLQRALEIRKKSLGERHPDFASGLDQMGKLMLRWEDLNGAEPLLLRAVEIRKSALGREHPEYAESLVALAEVFIKRGEAGGAERLLREALSVFKGSHGKNHPLVASTLSRLSDVLRLEGLADEALHAIRESADIYKRECGESHPDHMAALASLAGLIQERGDLDEAEPIWRLLLDMKRQARGEHLNDLSNIETQLGRLLQRRGDMKGAESLFRQALDSCKDAYGDRHPEFATSLTTLALLLQRAGDYQGAESLLRQALAVRKEVLGPRHPEYATSLINLASLVQKRGDPAWARMLLREAVEIRRTVFGGQHPEYAQGIASLADVYAQQGELDKAESTLREVLDIRGRVLGENHPLYASSLSSLAAVLRKAGNYEGAEALLLRALLIRRDAVGDAHPEYATNLGNLAWLLQRKGDRAGAEALLTQAIEVRRRLLGEHHPEYKQSVDRLRTLRESVTTTSDAAPNVPSSTSGLPNATVTPSAPPAEPVGAKSTRVRGRSLRLGSPPAGHAKAPSGQPARAVRRGTGTTRGADAEHPVDPVEPPAPDGDSIPPPVDPAVDSDRDVPPGVSEAAPPRSAGIETFPISFLRDSNEATCDNRESTAIRISVPGVGPTAVSSRVLGLAVARFENLAGTGLAASVKAKHPDPSPSAGATASSPQNARPESTITSGAHDVDAGEQDHPSCCKIPTDGAMSGGPAVDGRPGPEIQEIGGAATGCPAAPDVAYDVENKTVRSLLMSSSASQTIPDLSGAVGDKTDWSGATNPTASRALSLEIAGMSDRFAELGEWLLSTARKLHAPGTPPPEDLAEALATCRSDFESLRGRACELAGSHGISCPPDQELTGLQSLSELLAQVAQAEARQSEGERIKGRSLSILERVLTLRHASGTEFQPLLDCQDKARLLRDAISGATWASLPDEAQEIADGQHPVTSLISLIENHDDLHDDNWTHLHDSVRQAFGNPLAAAAARSRLHLPTGDDQSR